MSYILAAFKNLGTSVGWCFYGVLLSYSPTHWGLPQSTWNLYLPISIHCANDSSFFPLILCTSIRWSGSWERNTFREFLCRLYSCFLMVYICTIYLIHIYIYMYMCVWVLYMIMMSIFSYSVLWRYMLDWLHQFKYRQPVNNNDFNFGQSCMGPFLLYPILPRSTEERGSFPFAV